jgi:cytochrome c556
MNKMLLILFLIFIGTVSQSTFAESDPKNMKEVMQRISNDMEKLVGHLMKDEFEEVARYADKIANHDEPPLSQRLRMIANLGTEFTKFKNHDDEVHINATAMKKAADNRNVQDVIDNYTKVLTNCNNCHKDYRKQIQELNL